MITSAVSCHISLHHPVIILDLCTTINTFAGNCYRRLYSQALHVAVVIKICGIETSSVTTGQFETSHYQIYLLNNCLSILSYTLISRLIGCAPNYQHFDLIRSAFGSFLSFFCLLLCDAWIYKFRCT